MENWNTFLSEGRESKALYQAMIDAAPDGKWWKLKPSHHTRKAYRAYLDRKGGFGTKAPAADEDDWNEEEDDWGWECPPGKVEITNDMGEDSCVPADDPAALRARGWKQEWFTGHAYKDINDDCRKSSCPEFAAPSYLWWVDRHWNRQPDPKTGKYILMRGPSA
jgi:hypothetical protein